MVKGNYYIRNRTSGWYVWYQFWNDGLRVQQKVEVAAYATLGFRQSMTLEEAKKRCQQLNKERAIIKDTVRTAATKVVELESLDATLFPKDQIKMFQALLTDENFGSEQHLKKLFSHFEFVQNMCVELKIVPTVYKENAKRIYKYFIKKKISNNYSNRIINLLNRWGKFVCKHNGQFFEAVLQPRGREKSAIADAQQTKRGVNTDLGVREESEPLTPEILEAAKEKLKVENYNWLLISVWFGLRPEEIDGLKSAKNYSIAKDSNGTPIFTVYQPKLQSVAKEERWKHIPLILPQQALALEIVKSGVFKRPLTKTIRKYCGKGIGTYGGRKNFVDLMLSFEQDILHISAWMGHKDISTTLMHYKGKRKVEYKTPPASKLKLVK
jgi:integrase